MEWLAALIPLAASLFLFLYFKHKLVWWELTLPLAASVMFILIFKYSVKTTLVSDTEYYGSIIVEARYYEYWETWVDKTCSKQVADGHYYTGSGKNRTRHTKYKTVYYDCSYCDHNSAYWEAVDDQGNSWRISESEFQRLSIRWKSMPEFVELNRSINRSGGCGKDGDMYRVRWNGLVESSEAAVKEHSYINKVQASHSAFKLPVITKEEATKFGLYDYPSSYNYYKQRTVLGLEGLYNSDSVNIIETYFQYINGYYGPRSKMKLFVCLFYDKPMDIALKQQAYWDGGNQNELVVCVGVDKDKNIQWVHPFSWTDNKRILVDVREDIAELQTFQPTEVYRVITTNLSNEHHLYKDFKKDFDYLEVDLPTWSIVVIYLLTLLISIGVAYWCIKNDFHEGSASDKTKKFYKTIHSHRGFERHDRIHLNNKWKLK